MAALPSSAIAGAAADPPALDAPALHRRAMDNLEFIRDTMARAATVTVVSGWGIAASGVVALAAAARTAHVHDGPRWTAAWMVAATLSLPLSAGASVWKARSTARARGTPALAASGRRLLLSFLPPFTVGALLTGALAHAGLYTPLPALWLLSYGAGVSTGGAFSVRAVPFMGLAFLALGTLALLGDLLVPTPPAGAPGAWGNACMAAGFGLVHLGFGAYIARRHGG
ncbi:hypothetical protein tb265_14580 [Gemmatimonadetes bacterium T265]|nr:hypothetical protein tb265_14580 [Gemmatimonadetes bacterium T265]